MIYVFNLMFLLLQSLLELYVFICQATTG